MVNKQEKEKQGRAANFRGHLYEKAATFFLRTKGYHIIAVNLPGKRGAGIAELDIIAEKDKTLVFVEVKYRKHKDDTYDAITDKSKKRLINAASVFLAANSRYSTYSVRFDAILISGILNIEHIKEAFYP